MDYYFLVFYLFFYCCDVGTQGYSYKFSEVQLYPKCALLPNTTGVLIYPWVLPPRAESKIGYLTQYLKSERSCIQLELYIHPKGLLWVTVAVLIKPKNMYVMIFQGRQLFHEQELYYSLHQFGVSQNLTMVIPDKIVQDVYSVSVYHFFLYYQTVTSKIADG